MSHIFLFLALFVAADPPRVIDLTYVPQPGDTAYLDTGQKDEEGDGYAICAAVSAEEFVNYVRLGQVANPAEREKLVDQMEAAKKLWLLDPGTEAQVLAVGPLEVMRVQLPRGTLARGVVCAQVKVLGGEHKDKTLYVAPQEVVRYVTASGAGAVPVPPRKPAKAAKKKQPSTAPKTASPAARAASLWKLGQNLEKAGKTSGAVEFYRKLVKQFPGSIEAKAAAERLKALDPLP